MFGLSKYILLYYSFLSRVMRKPAFSCENKGTAQLRDTAQLSSAFAFINLKLGKTELICLLLFTCNYVVSVLRGFLFLWVLGMGYVILLWHSLSLPYNYYSSIYSSFVAVHPGLSRTWLDPPKTGFLMTRLTLCKPSNLSSLLTETCLSWLIVGL